MQDAAQNILIMAEESRDEELLQFAAEHFGM